MGSLHSVRTRRAFAALLSATLGLAGTVSWGQGFPDAVREELKQIAASVPDAVRVGREAELAALVMARRGRDAETEALRAAQVANQKRRGYGMVVSQSNKSARYRGQIRGGKAHGYGVETSSDGLGRRAGLWSDGFLELGVLRYSDGSRYEGRYLTVNDHFGVRYGGPGDHFVEERGEMPGGRLLGYGVILFKDGSSLAGRTWKGLIDGAGAKFSSSGDVVEQGAYDKGKLEMRASFALPRFSPAPAQ